MYDGLKIKLLILFISAIIVGFCVFLYFLDTSSAWGLDKILSCVLVNFWLFFMTSSLRGSYLRNRDKSAAEWFKMGMAVGASRIFLPVLFAPFYGVMYYFNLIEI